MASELELDADSRFLTTNPILVATSDYGLVEAFGEWTPPNFITKRPNEQLIGKYKVLPFEAGRPHVIASKLYGSQYLDWVIIAFNHADIVFGWPAADEVIEYPLPSVVFTEIS